jgi:hypothetical protein
MASSSFSRRYKLVALAIHACEAIPVMGYLYAMNDTVIRGDNDYSVGVGY